MIKIKHDNFSLIITHIWSLEENKIRTRALLFDDQHNKNVYRIIFSCLLSQPNTLRKTRLSRTMIHNLCFVLCAAPLLCRFLDALGLRKSKGYAINGAFLFISFFLVRILTMPFYYGKMFSVYDYPAFQVRRSVGRNTEEHVRTQQ